MGIKKAIAIVAISGCAAPASVQVLSNPEKEIAAAGHNLPIGKMVVADMPHIDTDTDIDNTGELKIADLCEPIDSRWEYPTSSEKLEIKQTIKDTCKAMGVGNEDCKFFYGVVSGRESSHRPWVRHKLPGDTAASLTSYLRRSRDYGWSVRLSDDSSDVEFVEYGPEQNAYFQDYERWGYGLGLGGLNVSYHLSKFDNMAPPEILCDPVINTIIQINIARIAMRNYGASNFFEVQAIYAGRTVQDDSGHLMPLSCSRGCPSGAGPEDRARARAGDANVAQRCSSYGLDCYARPSLGSFNVGSLDRQERYDFAAEIRGSELPEFE